MTEALAKGPAERTSDHTSVYDEILTCIPGQAIENAVSHYEQVYWDWVNRYYKSRIFLAQVENRFYNNSLHLKSDVNNLLLKESTIPESAIHQAMGNTVSGISAVPPIIE